MKLLLKINWFITIILSISTGIFKLLQQEADILLFEKIGFSPVATTLLGAVQLAGGLMLIFDRTRMPGAWLMIVTFVIASVAVFANGMVTFGFVSLIFIVMAVLVLHMVQINKQ